MNRLVLALALVATSAACHKEDPTATATSASASAQPAPTPFTGALTGDRVMAAKDIVHPFEKWTDAEPKLQAQLGKATYVKDGMHMWAVAQGDDCWYVEAEKQKDGTVGIVSEPMNVSKGGAIMNWDECLTAAGVRKDPVDDPNAPGPPTDGKPLTVTELKDGATKARSKWKGATVTVKGLFVNTTKATASGGGAPVTTATVSLTMTKGDVDHTVGCTLADPSTAPDTLIVAGAAHAVKPKPGQLVQYTPIQVTGTVEVNDMISLAGNRSVDVDLKDCSITKK